jgi:hypothetical protein
LNLWSVELQTHSSVVMPQATETAIIYLKPDSNFEDASSPAAAQLRKCLDIVAALKGYQRQYYGRQLEDPSLFIWSIGPQSPITECETIILCYSRLMAVSDWDDVSNHHDFMKSDSYKDFIAEVAAVFDLDRGAPALTHANYASHPPNGPREAPVTEFACFALPASAGNEQKSALEDAVLNLATTCSRVGSCISFATGWVVEDLDHDKGTDGKAIGFSALLGWPSKEDHMKSRESPEFLETARPVRGIALPPTTGYKGTAMFHAKLVRA